MTFSSSNVRVHVFSPFFGPAAAASIEAAGPGTPVEPSAEPAPAVELAPPTPEPDFQALAAEARVEGFQRGYEEGLQQARSEQEALTGRLATIVEDAGRDTAEFIRALERQVVDLALAVAARVIEREARTDRELITGVIRGALDEIQDATRVYVRVNPIDYDVVAQHWQSLVHQPSLEQSRLIADDRVQQGGCLLDTQTGQVDAQLETKLDQIKTAFDAVHDREPV